MVSYSINENLASAIVQGTHIVYLLKDTKNENSFYVQAQEIFNLIKNKRGEWKIKSVTFIDNNYSETPFSKIIKS